VVDDFTKPKFLEEDLQFLIENSGFSLSFSEEKCWTLNIDGAFESIGLNVSINGEDLSQVIS
jgi:hypothetical protein